jgi:hypothetical protein
MSAMSDAQYRKRYGDRDRESRGCSPECVAAVAALSPRARHAYELLVRGAPLDDIGATLELPTDSVELDAFTKNPLTEGKLYPGRAPASAPPLRRAYQARVEREAPLAEHESGFDLGDFETLLGFAGHSPSTSPWG